MLTVHELSDTTGVSPDTIRHYVRVGLLNPIRNENNGYKLFSDSDKQYLHFICQAKGLGFSLKEIQQILHDADVGESPCPRVRKILQQRIEENRQKLDKLVKLQVRMERALSLWQSMPDGNPDGHSVCHLIECMHNTEKEKSL